MKYTFHVFWLLIAVLLGLFSFLYEDRSEAMVAIVDNEATAYSYDRPVRVREIFVVPGQEVDSGQILFEVDRSQLMTDIRNAQTERVQVAMEIEGLTDDYFTALNKLMIEIKKENLEAKDIRKNTSRQHQALKRSFRKDSIRLSRQVELLDKKIAKYQAEPAYMVGVAKFDGTIGQVDIQLDELVSPFSSLVTLYQTNPTVIKAFANENRIREMRVGTSVIVESDNRSYRVDGKIIEIGHRIVEYPESVNAHAQVMPLFGQEVFVKISEGNHFLNGEKVYVHLKH